MKIENNRKWLLTQFGISAVFLILFINFVIPVNSRVLANSVAIKRLKGNLISAENGDEIVKHQENKMTKIRKKFKKLKQSQNTIETLSSLIKDIEQKAEDNSLNILAIKPDEPVIQKDFIDTPLVVEITGSYNAIGFVIHYWENKNNLVVEKVEMEKQNVDSQQTIFTKVFLHFISFKKS